MKVSLARLAYSSYLLALSARGVWTDCKVGKRKLQHPLAQPHNMVSTGRYVATMDDSDADTFGDMFPGKSNVRETCSETYWLWGASAAINISGKRKVFSPGWRLNKNGE